MPLPPKNSNFRSSQPIKPSSAQRRAKEQSAVAGKQAQLKAEAAERAAARAQRDAEKANSR
jgi:hypothetical protein